MMVVSTRRLLAAVHVDTLTCVLGQPMLAITPINVGTGGGPYFLQSEAPPPHI